MRLEPSRSSLSGRPDFLQAPKVQTSAPVVKPRRCVKCGVGNVAHLLHGEMENSLESELKYLNAQNKEQAQLMITPYLATRGWKYRYHLGRHAMERDICKPCLEGCREMEQEFARKRSRELKSNTDGDPYYMAIAGDGQ